MHWVVAGPADMSGSLMADILMLGVSKMPEHTALGTEKNTALSDHPTPTKSRLIRRIDLSGLSGPILRQRHLHAVAGTWLESPDINTPHAT